MSLNIDFTFFGSPKISDDPNHSINFSNIYDEYNPFCTKHITGKATKKGDRSNEAMAIENDLTLLLINDDLEIPSIDKYKICHPRIHENYSDTHKKLWKQLENDVSSYFTMAFLQHLAYFDYVQRNTYCHTNYSYNSSHVVYSIMNISSFNVAIYLQLFFIESLATYDKSISCMMLQLQRQFDDDKKFNRNAIVKYNVM